MIIQGDTHTQTYKDVDTPYRKYEMYGLTSLGW